MKTLYLDIFSGLSGDMFIGALLDLGVNFHDFERELAKLGLAEYHLHFRRDFKSAIEGVKFDVHVAHDHDHHHHDHEDGADHDHGPHHHHEGHDHHEHHHAHHHHEDQHARHDHDHGDHDDDHAHEHGRGFSEIRELLTASALSPWVKQKAIAIFTRIARAEGKIHGVPADEVHFHEVGAVDSIVDIAGACVALEMLGKPRVLAGPVVEGTGFIECAHGSFPIPAPATLSILGDAGIAITQTDEPHELVTPTGAAILAEFAESFGPMRGLVAEKVGFGLGARNNRTRPNVLRAILGKSIETPVHDWEIDTVAGLETNLDDCLPEALGRFMGRAMEAGALDVYYTAAQMKKNRPGTILTVLCEEHAADRFAEMILRETTAFGVRRTTFERRKLRREFKPAQTRFGAVQVKIGRLDGKILHASPEFESCRELADATGESFLTIYREAQVAAQRIHD